MDLFNILDPTPYHQQLLAYLKTEEPALWDWFSSNRLREEHADGARLELLKTTYRLDRDAAPQIHELADAVCARLELDVPIEFYQSQLSDGLNASLVFVPGQVHVVLHGPVTERLTEAELRCLLGHELAHFLLWTRWDGEYHVAEQILTALTNDPLAETPHFESARLFRLYTEIFCDRGALSATGELADAVSTLVKMETGLKKVRADNYLKQADEIFSKSEPQTAGLTHPECYIRARAIKLWHEQQPDAEAQIRRMIEGPISLEGLDLLGQVRLSALTRRLIDAMLAPAFMQTETVLGHARLFFEDYAPANDGDDEPLADDLATPDEQLQDYYCYVLLDFATTDRDLDDAALAAAALLASRMGWKDRFGKLAVRELGLRKKQWEQLQKDAERIVADATKSVAAK